MAMDLDAPASPEAELCSICLDPVAAAPSPGVRSIALLQCGHKFHLGQSGALPSPFSRPVPPPDLILA